MRETDRNAAAGWMASGTALVAALGGCGEPAGLPPVEMPSVEVEEAPVRVLLEELRAAVAAAPADGARHGDLGLGFEANGLWHSAEQSFAQAAQLEPGEPRWLVHRAIALRRMGEVDAELELLERAATALPDDAALLHRLGVARFQDGDFEGAGAAFRGACAARPEEPLPRLGLADVALAAGDASTAADEARSALTLDPRLTGAHYTLGLALAALGEERAAAAELALGSGGGQSYLPTSFRERRAELTVGSIQRMLLAQEQLDLGRADEAARILEGVVRDHPDKHVAIASLAAARVELGQHDEARELVERALALEPGYFLAHAVGAYCELAAGDLDAALDRARQAVEADPGAARTQRALGDVLMAREQYSQAYDAYERALALNPANPALADAFGTAAALVQRYEQAAESLERALKLDPTRLDARLKLVGALMRLREYGRARAELARAAAQAPNHPQVRRLEETFDEAARRAGG